VQFVETVLERLGFYEVYPRGVTVVGITLKFSDGSRYRMPYCGEQWKAARG
jgi:hypothetical protein